jgi:uncharacterized protein involved in response to NO
MTAPPDHTPIPRLRPWAGSALLAYGFRPFFLAAGVWAAVALALWLAALRGPWSLPTALTPLAWHVHEMIFGFAAAALAGFLLTAIPNWTGRLPLQGRPLLLLVLLWLAGRMAMVTSAIIGPIPAAALDLAFLVAVLAAAGREVAAGRNWRNLPVLAAVALLVIGNALFHAEVVGLGDATAAAWRLSIGVLVALIVLIGGRIVPSFTRNWLVKRDAARLPAPFGSVDRLTIVVSVLALATWVALPDSWACAALAALAALGNGVRLARWRGDLTTPEPLVFVLHLAYAWIPLAFALLALAAAGFDVPELAAVHGFGAGAIATMILAVMTRATLGHTGRALRADGMTTAIYALATIAAAARLASALYPQAYAPMLWTSGLAWIAAFGLFVLHFGPMLARPRPDGKPG